MATHLYWDESTKFGAKLRQMLDGAEASLDSIVDVRERLIQMRDLDGSQDAHYAMIVRQHRFGGYEPTQGDPSAAQLAMAHAFFDVLSGAVFAVEEARAALEMLFARTR